MMVLSALRPDASLPEFLAHRARSASIRRLAADIVIGVGTVGSALWWTSQASLFLTGVGLAFTTYGVWGIADRARSRDMGAPKGSFRKIMDLLCALMVAIGVIAFAAILYSGWAVALGTWIS